MEGTDISLSDGNYFHDHTYYGNGCENEWGPGGSGGSTKACSTNKVNSFDNEEQRIGVYYDYQAATSGTGAAIATGNTDSPDTFCPLGWQLPYSGTGGDYYDKSRSWNYLFDTYGISYNPSGASEVAKVKSYPLSYVFSGIFFWIRGQLSLQDSDGYYWSSTIVNNTSAYDHNTWATVIRPSSTYAKGGGMALRCVLCILASGKRAYFYFEKQKSRAFVFFADPTRRRGAHQRGAP